MRLTPGWQACALAAAIGAAAGVARADEVATAPAPDKSRYWLLDPVPGDKLRDMDTDRPNVTNTPHTIDAGHVQVETGVLSWAYDRLHFGAEDERTDAFAFGQFDVRLGVTNDLELNAVVTAYDAGRVRNYAARTTARNGGFADVYAGAKLNLWGDDGADGVGASGLAVQPQLKSPTDRDGVGNGRFEFSLPVPFVVNLPDGFHLGVQFAPSLERNTSDTGYVAGLGPSVSVDRVVFDKLDVYLEYAADPTTQRHVKTPETIDVGGVYQLTPNLTLDTGFNVGLNRASNTLTVLAGFSFRL